MNGNPFYVQPSGDYGQQLLGLGEIINRKRMQDREIALQDEELNRQRMFRDETAKAFGGIDPITGQPIAQQPTQIPAEQERFVPDFKEPYRFESILDPKAAAYESKALENIGITPDKYGEVKDFIGKWKSAETPEEKRQLALERVKTIADRGGDASDTAALLRMPSEESNKVLNVVDMIVDRDAVRRMAAIDPIATQRILEAGRQSGDKQTDLSHKMLMLEETLKMPEGPEKDARLMFLSAKPKTRSFDEALRLSDEQEKTKTEELRKREGIKTDAEILKEMRMQTETPQGKLDTAKKNSDMIALRSAEEAKSYDAQDSIDLIDDLASSELSKIYGRGESIYPELLRSQKGIDIMSKRERLIGTIKMAGRGQLKGQGTVSDMDAKMLSDAATTLGNPNISPEAAKAELARVKEALDRSMKSSAASASAATVSEPTVDATDDSALFNKYGI